MNRLLIVDDESIIADGLVQLFRSKHHEKWEVFAAYSADEAAAIAGATKIDVVLSDIRMPGKDGLHLLDEIAARLPFCQFVFLTGYSDFQYIYTAVQKNIAGYLLKSESFETIAEAVEKAMRNAKEVYKSLNVAEGLLVRSSSIAGDEPKQPLAEKIHSYISENLAGDLSLGRIAEALYFNPSYLSRMYKQETGSNLSQYIQNAKTTEAMRLLSDTQLKIQEIGLLLGFETPSYFTAFFKKMSGASPQEFREKLACRRMNGARGQQNIRK